MKKVKNHKEVKAHFAGCDRATMAKELGVSVNYLSQVIDGFKLVSPKRAIEWSVKSGIDRKILRPDIFGDNV